VREKVRKAERQAASLLYRGYRHRAKNRKLSKKRKTNDAKHPRDCKIDETDRSTKGVPSISSISAFIRAKHRLRAEHVLCR